MWVLGGIGGLGFLGYLSKHIREILEVISFKKTRALEAKVEMDVLNKGAVRLHIDKLEFSVRGIYTDSPLEPACNQKYPRLLNQLNFPEEIEDGSLFVSCLSGRDSEMRFERFSP